VAGYIPKWFTNPQTVTHPTINQARRSYSTLIETNALLLNQATTGHSHNVMRTQTHRCLITTYSQSVSHLATWSVYLLPQGILHDRRV